jgi:hypothetical protein
MKTDLYQFKINKTLYTSTGYSVQNAWCNLMKKDAFNLQSENHISPQGNGVYTMSFNDIKITKL